MFNQVSIRLKQSILYFILLILPPLASAEGKYTRVIDVIPIYCFLISRFIQEQIKLYAFQEDQARSYFFLTGR